MDEFFTVIGGIFDAASVLLAPVYPGVATGVSFLGKAASLGATWMKQGKDPNYEIEQIRSAASGVEKIHDKVQDRIDDLWGKK